MSKMITGMVIVLAMTATQAFATDVQVSKNTLEKFGLSGLEVVSDTDGMNVRGQGAFTYVSGGSYSILGGPGGSTGTWNRYRAGSSNQGTSRSSGGSGSASYRTRIKSMVAAVRPSRTGN
ncbi:MAG: hypothetical protein MK102_18020 [Fuerstiella sp.]|nr:hypothetical protein [Fuerstiella sp.]